MRPTLITGVDVLDLDLPLREPFGVAGGAQPAARNLLVKVRLADGSLGLGEAAPFPAVNGETQEIARAALLSIRERLLGLDARRTRPLGAWLRELVPGAASAVCAVETAVLDALLRHQGVPMWVHFGGAEESLVSDMTIPTGSAEAARRAARRIVAEGYRTLKLKVGGAPLDLDLLRVQAVCEEAGGAALILDGNAGLPEVGHARELLRAAALSGGGVRLFEQPFGKDDLAAMRELAEATGVLIAADESAACARDVLRLARERAAQVVNIKIMKSGLSEALDMIACARALGLGLMIGGMVESSLAMTASACLAAGQGGFSFVDLDTPRFLASSPFAGGYQGEGPRMDLAGIESGHGVRLKEVG